MSVMGKAKELARALEESQEFRRLQEARETVKNHEAASIMLRDLAMKEEQLAKAINEGREITESEKAEYRRMAEIVAMNPYIRDLMEAEYHFAELLSKVNKVIAESLGLEGNVGGTRTAPEQGTSAGQSAAPGQDAGQVSKPKSRLWVPGSR